MQDQKGLMNKSTLRAAGTKLGGIYIDTHDTWPLHGPFQNSVFLL